MQADRAAAIEIWMRKLLIMCVRLFWTTRATRWFAVSTKTLANAALSVIAVATSIAFAQTKPLNDTGIFFCGGATSGLNAPCLATDPAGQDKNYGRDAAAAAGTLIKVGASAVTLGGGTNGFDFTKIANNGSALPASAALGTGTSDWACTRDNFTGLIWEVKTTSGLRDYAHSYTWYMTGSPDGNNGTPSGGACATSGRCDTEKFVADVNASGLCGATTGWRMPTVKELQGIVDFGRVNPAIDPAFFPNTSRVYVWSGSLYSGRASTAWVVNANYGNANFNDRSSTYYVRLVRGGQ